MNSLADMIWIEWRKATRSGMPLWTALGSLAMPLGIAFLIFAARNPQISQKLGLISAKANLLAYSATDWPTYLGLFGQVVAAGGFFLFVLAITWVFGREFADGTVKDLLAVPVPRGTILLAKFVVCAVWSAGLAVVIFSTGMLMGALIQLPAASAGVFWQGSALVVLSAGLAILVALPFALVASVGRGYLLPVGLMLLALLLANLLVVAGWGEYFPWAVPMLYAQGKSELGPVSFVIVLLTGLAGMIATYAWWKWADQAR